MGRKTQYGITIHCKDFTQSGFAFCFAPIICDIFNKLLAKFPSVAGKEYMDQGQPHLLYFNFGKTFDILYVNMSYAS